jgi:hypothetical protein
MERFVERADLGPEPVEFAGEFVGRHVVFGAPVGAQVAVAQVAGALVGDFHLTGEALAHRSAHGVPSRPGVTKLVGIMAGPQDALDVG